MKKLIAVILIFMIIDLSSATPASYCQVQAKKFATTKLREPKLKKMSPVNWKKTAGLAAGTAGATYLIISQLIIEKALPMPPTMPPK